MRTQRIAILGGGCSGALLAAELLSRADSPLDVAIVEPRAALGQGPAYATPFPVHLLNVPARRLSGRVDDPSHFVSWLAVHAPEHGEQAFVPRSLYGRYLESLLDDARARSASGTRLDHLRDTAVDLRMTPGGVEVVLARGKVIQVDRVVLAFGNLAPDALARLAPAGDDPGRYVRDPWSPGALDFSSPDGDVLVLGTGLTAVDVVLGLRHRGHQGRLVAVSRRGLLPRAHRPASTSVPAASGIWDLAGPVTAGRLVRHLREQVNRAASEGGDWRIAVDALRERTQSLWGALPSDERARFLRHLQSLWDVHRHRMAPAVAEVVDGLAATGALTVMAGRVVALVDEGGTIQVRIRPRGTSSTVEVAVRHVVDCTGPTAVARTPHPLLRRLLDEGVVRADDLGLGLAATPAGCLISLANPRGDRLFAMGALLKGTLWETTAVAEIRRQAADLASTLLSLRPRSRPLSRSSRARAILRRAAGR